MDQIRNIHAQMQGLMCGGYENYTSQAPLITSQPTSYTASTHNPCVLAQTHQYGMLYQNSWSFNNHDSRAQVYDFQPTTSVNRYARESHKSLWKACWKIEVNLSSQLVRQTVAVAQNMLVDKQQHKNHKLMPTQ